MGKQSGVRAVSRRQAATAYVAVAGDGAQFWPRQKFNGVASDQGKPGGSGQDPMVCETFVPADVGPKGRGDPETGQLLGQETDD